MGKSSGAVRAAIVFAVLATLGGCGSGAKDGLGSQASASSSSAGQGASGCAATVLGTLGKVAERVYHEGVASERTGAALSFIAHSTALREAVERNDPAQTQTAAQALIATGHVTSLEVIGGGGVLVKAGAPKAVAPLRGSILDTAGKPIGSFVASVWGDDGLVAETDGLVEGLTALREGGRSVGGSFGLPGGELPAQGELSLRGVSYRYTSFPGTAYPQGNLRIYVLERASSIATLCGKSEQDTLVNTLRRVANLIYDGEAGSRAQVQVKRVQHNEALLGAVAAREPEATRLAIDGLLNQHIVRLRVKTGGRLLSDVGGPYVLAPVQAPLRLHGKRIGELTLSIQDDLGYLKLTNRLAGLKVAMYRGSRLVMSSLSPAPSQAPASGTFTWAGHDYRVFTVHAQAFPSGPLRIAVLVPIPYS